MAHSYCHLLRERRAATGSFKPMLESTGIHVFLSKIRGRQESNALPEDGNELAFDEN
jgi:hypothetical protein